MFCAVNARFEPMVTDAAERLKGNKGGNRTFTADANKRESQELNHVLVHLIFVANQSLNTADQS